MTEWLPVLSAFLALAGLLLKTWLEKKKMQSAHETFVDELKDKLESQRKAIIHHDLAALNAITDDLLESAFLHDKGLNLPPVGGQKPDHE
jgi:hypothetical protein